MYDRRREGTEAVFGLYYAVFIGVLLSPVAIRLLSYCKSGRCKRTCKRCSFSL